jgi:hypothetical protein
MTDDSQLTFSVPSVSHKKVTAAFDGGRLSSDSGVMLLALAGRRRKVADTLAAHIADRRDPERASLLLGKRRPSIDPALIIRMLLVGTLPTV